MLAYLNNNLDITLRLLQEKDCERVRKWLQDPYIIDLTFVIPGPERQALLPFDAKTINQYIEALLIDKSRKTFAIEAGGEHVGNIGLKELNYTTKKAELFIEIGESEYRGMGIGKAAITILMDYGLVDLGLQEICLEVLEFNQAALRVYEQMGFKTLRRSGWHYDKNSRYWQVLWMCLPKEQWLLVRDRLLLPGNLTLNPL